MVAASLTFKSALNSSVFFSFKIGYILLFLSLDTSQKPRKHVDFFVFLRATSYVDRKR